jgi:hypothetical protein
MIEKKDLWLQEADANDFETYEKWAKIGQEAQKNGNALGVSMARLILAGFGVGYEKINALF